MHGERARRHSPRLGVLSSFPRRRATLKSESGRDDVAPPQRLRSFQRHAVGIKVFSLISDGSFALLPFYL